MNFCQLHLHTYFSILDGLPSPEDYVQKAKELGMKALSITDHGSMSGILRFSNECRKQDIKGIIGCEFYVNNNRDIKDSKNNHIVLLAKNKKGYRNLLKINYESVVDGFYYRPRTTEEFIFSHSNGIICTSACMASSISRLILDNKEKKAERKFLEYKEAFGDDFYGELIFNELKDQIKVTKVIFDMCKAYDVKFIVTGDCHYIEKADAKVQDIMLMVNTRKRISDKNVFRFSTRNLYFHIPDDYFDFNDRFGFRFPRKIIEEGLENTLEVADKCDFILPEEEEIKFPLFIRNGKEIKYPDKILEPMCWKALEKSEHKDSEIYKRTLEKELSVIKEKTFSAYFLIIKDIIDFCNKNNIAIGAGRGSVAGCLIAYLLGITKIDPIRFGLLFERFLSRTRKDPPDIDLDFESEKKFLIERYLKNKYGEDRVAHIITFGRFGIKGAVRDIARVFGKEKEKGIQSVVKNLGDEDTTINNDILTPFQKQYMRDNKKIFYYALKMVGRIRQPGQHAGGTVITPGPLYNYIPVYRVKGDLVTGLTEGKDYRELDQLGILKIDILGLKQVDILKRAKQIAKEAEIDLDNLNFLDDPSLYRALNKYPCVGIFQFENLGIDAYVKRVKPECFEDVVAINALYRPAILNAGTHEEYIKNRIIIKKWEKKHNKKYKGKSNNKISQILASTYGVLVFQEQFMEILHKVGGFTLEEADEARKTFKILYLRRQSTEGKKEDPELLKVTSRFKKGALRNTNMTEDEINGWIDLLAEFAEYSFNRSHSVSYSVVVMQTLYMREKHPLAFYCALLDKSENRLKPYGYRKENKVEKYFNFIKFRGMDFLPIDINQSKLRFNPEGGKIRIPLIFIPGIGSSLANEIIKRAPYRSFSGFCKEELNFKSNKTSVLNLIKIGAFDSLNSNRKALGTFYQEWAGVKSRHKKKDEVSVNSIMLDIWEKHKNCEYATNPEKKEDELSICKFNIFCGTDVALMKKIKKYADEGKVFPLSYRKEINKVRRYCCEIKALKPYIDKRDKEMMFMTGQDWLGNQFEILLFANIWKRYKDRIENNKFYLVKAYWNGRESLVAGNPDRYIRESNIFIPMN